MVSYGDLQVNVHECRPQWHAFLSLLKTKIVRETSLKLIIIVYIAVQLLRRRCVTYK